jgi:hypothetical protein
MADVKDSIIFSIQTNRSDRPLTTVELRIIWEVWEKTGQKEFKRKDVLKILNLKSLSNRCFMPENKLCDRACRITAIRMAGRFFKQNAVVPSKSEYYAILQEITDYILTGKIPAEVAAAPHCKG